MKWDVPSTHLGVKKRVLLFIGIRDIRRQTDIKASVIGCIWGVQRKVLNQ